MVRTLSIFFLEYSFFVLAVQLISMNDSHEICKVSDFFVQRDMLEDLNYSIDKVLHQHFFRFTMDFEFLNISEPTRIKKTITKLHSTSDDFIQISL